MLLHLNISNYALIDSLDLKFEGGFTVITGETGAGKSIILGALALVLGNRADTSSLQDKTRKCIVEAHFDISAHDINDFFNTNDIDYEQICILRREILPAGKSRSFINDTPVKLNIIKELGDKLVDIHSQNRTITINDADVQMAIVDQVAGNQDLLEKYTAAFKKYQELRRMLAGLHNSEKEAARDRDYFQFLFDELDSAAIIANEEADGEKELQLLSKAEEIKSALYKANDGLSDGEQNVVSILNSIYEDLGKHAAINDEISAIAERLNSLLIEIKDISGEISLIDDKLEFRPDKISQLEERLDLINTLLHKHQAESSRDLLDTLAEIDAKLLQYTSLKEEIQKAEKAVNRMVESLENKATELHKKRKKAVPGLEKEILSLLHELGMKDARFGVEVLEQDVLSAEGKSAVRFLFNANRGGEMQPMHKVASGGEMSRLMLAVKSLVSEKNSIPTIIFDEIDNGVSGDIAGRVGNIMNKMALKRQLLVISHLPQIAASSQHHFLVYKKFDRKFTHSLIKPLTEAERIEEVAKMLSGDNITEAARKTATELLERS